MADRTTSPVTRLTRRTLLAASCLAGLDAALAQPVPAPPAQRPVSGKKYPPKAYMFIDETIAANLLYKLEVNVSDALANGVTSILMVVSSPGGNIDSAVGIHNIFSSISPQVTSYNISAVDSAANVIFQAASKRIAHPNSHFLFHPIANLSTITGLNAAGARDASDSLRESTRQVQDILRSRTKLTQAQLDEMFKTQVIVGAKQALDYGIVDEVAELGFPLGQIMIPTI